MKKLSVYLSLALAVAGLAACEKEIEEVAQPKVESAAAVQQTPQALLTSAAWRQTDLSTTSLAAGTNEPTTVSLFARLKAEQKDNLTQFSADGGYVLDEGATKSDPHGAQQKTGTYQLSEDAKTLVVKLPEFERSFTVEELSATTLRLKVTDGEGNAAVSYTSTFSH
ncbi:hypothetical protein [Hymenobacter sp. B81]|uniref:hypothetical protein n=1 Tax=Hymenobacter sp. B81 TaxID=3344878 RepID=UPI0037DD445C